MNEEFFENSWQGGVLILLGISLIIGTVGYLGYRDIHSDRTKRAQERQDCVDLNAKYGEILTAKEGPFGGTKLKAQSFSPYTIGTVINGDPQVRYFECADLKRFR